MNYSIIPQTRMTNINGVMGYSMYFGLENLIKANTRLYFYKYNIYDLVEVELTKELLTIYTFPDCDDGIERVIIDDMDFFIAYFDSAGLRGKRFVFDTKNKMPVSYSDFSEVESIISYSYNRDIIFILDKGDGGYITKRREITCYKAIENTREVDNCILSLENDLINITKPKYIINYKATNTITILALISGFLSGISRIDTKEQLPSMELNQKFLFPFKGVDYNSDYVESKMKGLNTEIFSKIALSNAMDFTESILKVDAVDKEFDKNEEFMSVIMDTGLDKFIKSIKNSSKVVKVIIDAEWQNIVSMYIVKGCAFISPGANKQLNYFRDIFDSDNVQLVMN